MTVLSSRFSVGKTLVGALLVGTACTLGILSGVAHAQQLNLAVGGSTLTSTKDTTASQAYLPGPEKGGMYPSFSGEYIRKNHFGLSVEGTFRAKRGLYNGYQPYRPILYDVNGVFAPRFGAKVRGSLMAGFGGQTVLFYDPKLECPLPSGACRTYLNSTHMLLHGGAGVRYYFWGNYFVRPEVHYYFVKNNVEFHSDHLFRVGVSVGHTFGSR